MLNTHTLSDAFTTRCCGPDGCGAPVQTGAHGPGRYCVAHACMAWQWATANDAEPTEAHGTSAAAPNEDAYKAACAARSVVPWNADDSEYDAACAAVEQAAENVRTELASWEPEPPAGEGWRLTKTETLLYDDGAPEPVARFRATWERDKAPTERRGRCGYAVRS